MARERRDPLRGVLDLALGHGSGQLLGLIRNFAVARLLGPEDFGVAATFAATVAIVEATTDVGLDKYLVQTARGEDPALQRTIHGLMAARGLVTALAVFLLADPAAALFGAPETAAGFRWLALAPLLRGFAHTDVKRLQRGLSFRREAAVMAAAQCAALVVAVGLALLLRSWWAMLWGVLAHAAVQAAMTHRLAERSYRLGLAPAEAQGALAFGWPLTLSGVLLALAAQGDRVVVGAALGLGELGVYAAATILTTAVVGTAMQVASGAALPWLASVQSDRPAFLARHRALGAGWALIGVAIFPSLTLLGDDAVALVFGEAFRPTPALMAAVALAALLRLARAWPSGAAMALGDTRTALIGNAVKPLGLAAAWFAAAGGAGLAGVALGMALGEAAATCATSWRLATRHGVSARADARAPGIMAATALTAAMACVAAPMDAAENALLGAGLAAIGAAAVLLLTEGGRSVRRVLVARLAPAPAEPS
jgi:O-antigen/teichoic acid export membrane protein